jgi:Na+/proline symporter
MVTFVSLVGGAFGVAASDFVQMFLVVTVTLVISAFALYQPAVGGFSGLMEKVPASYYHWGEFARPEFIALWFLALTFNNIFTQNTMEMSAKYLMARSDAHARKMVLFPLIGTIVGPLLWLLPPMVASVTHPGGLGNILPTLSHPDEGAFLVTAHDVLPAGMLGLLVAGIFGATLSSLDASVNQGVGILVRNFYLPVINPKCPEKQLLLLSKCCTAAFGLFIINIGLIVSQQRSAGLFDFLNQFGVGLYLPLAVPMCLGLFYKRTPPWSGWSTVLVGLVTSFFIMLFVKTQAVLDPSSTKFLIHIQIWVESHLHVALPTITGLVGWIPGLAAPLKQKETAQAVLIATAFGVIIVSVTWYFLTSLFYEKSPAQYRANVEEFFARLKKPIEDMTAEQVKENAKVVGAIGLLCMIFGAFVVLMMLVPNTGLKRIAFLFSGGSIFGVGWLLQRVSKRKRTPTLPAKPAKLSPMTKS